MQLPAFLDATTSLHRLRDLRRRYLIEEFDLQAAVTDAQADLDRWTRLQLFLRVERAPTAPLGRLCDRLSDGFASLERDLAEVRTALVAIDAEILELETRLLAARQSSSVFRATGA